MAHGLVSQAKNVVSRRIDDAYVVLDEAKLIAHHLTGEVAQVWTDVLAGTQVDLDSPAVSELADLGLIVLGGGVGRRTAIKRAGVVVGLGITSLALPEAAVAASATSLNKATAGTYCVTVPAGQTTASVTLTGAGGGAGGGTTLIGGAGGAGAKLNFTVGGLIAGDVIVVVVGQGGTAGFLAAPGVGGTGYDAGGNGAASLTAGGGGGGATSIGVVRGAAPGSCPSSQVWSGAVPTVLGVAGAGGGGGGIASSNGSAGGTTNAGSTAAAGGVGKVGGLLSTSGGGGGGGGVSTPAAGGVGGGGGGGKSGWANAGAWTITLVGSGTTATNGGSAFLGLIGNPGGDGSGVVTFP